VSLSRPKIAVLDQFERRADEWNCAEFDRAMKASLGDRYVNREAATYAIADAHEVGRWPRTVERYVRANHRASGTVAGAFLPFAHQFGIEGEAEG